MVVCSFVVHLHFFFLSTHIKASTPKAIIRDKTLGCLPFTWKTRKFQLENRMVRIIPFGVLLKLWASGQSDAFLLLLWDLQLMFIHFACYPSSVKAGDTPSDFIRRSRRIWSPPIDADTPGDFFRRSRRCGSFENSWDKIAQPDGLALLAIRSNKRRKSRDRAHLANAGEFNRQYLTFKISAILYADRGDRRKSQSLHRAHLAIFADRRDRRIKSLGCLRQAKSFRIYAENFHPSGLRKW